MKKYYLPLLAILLAGTASGQTIVTSSINGSPFCAGSGLTVPFTLNGTVNTGNIFTAQLSDATGSFSNPVNIGSRSATSSGSINAVIPSTIAAGSAYRIRVIASNPATIGLANTTNLAIKAKPLTPVAVNVRRCGPGAVNLSASGSGSGAIYRWFNVAAGGSVMGTGASYSPSVNANATFYVEALLNGCLSSRKAIKVTIDPQASVSINASAQTISLGGSVNLSAVVNPVVASTYAWSGPGLNATATANVIAKPTSTGLHTYTVVQTNGTCTSSATVQIQVNPGTTTIVTGNVAGSPFCAGSGVSVPFTMSGSVNSGNVFTAQLSNASGSFASPVNIGTRASTTVGPINAIIPGSIAAGAGYRIRVIASNPATTGSANTANLTIKARPALPVSASMRRCGNGSLTLNASGSGSGAIYHWFDAASGGTPLETGVSFTTPVLNATKTYYVQATLNGCQSQRRAVTAYIDQPLNVTAIATPSSITLGNSVTLSAMVNPNIASTFSWSGPGLNTNAGASVTATPATVGTHTYTVVQTNKSCSNSTTVQVQVTPGVTTVTPGTINGSPFCAGSGVSVPYTVSGTINSGNIFTAQLSNSAGSFASPINIGSRAAVNSGTINAVIPASITAGGGYRIRIIASDPALVSVANSANLSVKVKPAQPLSSNVRRCGPGTVNLTASGSGSAAVYTWYDVPTGGTALGTGASFTTPSINANKYLYVQAEVNGCVSLRKAVLVYVDPLLTLNAQASTNTINLGSTVDLSASVSPSVPATFTWSGPGLNTTAGALVKATPTTLGSHTYTVVQVNGACMLTADVIVNVIGDVTRIGSTSAPVEQPLHLSAYPNPFNGNCTLHVNAQSEGFANLVVLDAAGKQITAIALQLTEGNQDVKLPLPATLPIGLYMIRIKQGNITTQLRILKE